MTECNTKTIELTRLSRKKVVADFTGGRMTSDAGLVMLREVERKLRLFDRVDAVVRDPRKPSTITHSQRTLIAQRIAAIAAGYEDLNDHETLRNDPAIQLFAGNLPEDTAPLASPSTLCRIENRITRDELVAMNRLFVEWYIESFETPPEEIILDFDATNDPVHGEQMNRFFHGYYDEYCFLPLYVFSCEQMLCAYLRPSDIDAAKHAWAILALITKRLRQVWPNVRIVFRGDSGFCRWKMLRWCEKNRVNYIVGIGKNPRLEEESESWRDAAETQYILTDQKQRLFGEFLYAAKTWDRPRRIIVKAEHTRLGANTRYVVTDLDGRPQKTYDEIYCARGEMENRIKEQQLMLFADRTSCHDFLANQFRLMLSSFAYVLLETLRRTALAATPLAHAQVSTIRVTLLKIAARVTISARRILLSLRWV
jgi:hypothetical protein